MADPDRLITFLQLEHEERFLGYRESLPWDELKQKITKTAMGLANIRDGGTIIIGVSKKGNRHVPKGMAVLNRKSQKW